MDSTVGTHLPPQMSRYASFPWSLFLLWAALSAFLLFRTGDGIHAQHALSNVSPSDVHHFILSVKAGEQWTMELRGAEATLQGSELSGYSIAGISFEAPPANLIMSDPKGEIRYTLNTRSDTVFELRDMHVGEVTQISLKDSGMVIERPHSVSYRIKIKPDKFNLIGPVGIRMLHGKYKSGGIVVKTENDHIARQIELSPTQSGPEGLLWAGIISLPISLPERALLLARFVPFPPSIDAEE